MSIRTGPLRRSRRLASIIPFSCWRRLGYTDMESFHLETMQTHMRNTQQDEDNFLCLMSSDIDVNDEGYPVRQLIEHNDLMLPHWEKYARALRQKKKTDLIDIMFKAIQLPLAVLEIIVPSLQNMRSIQICECGLGTITFRYLCSHLHKLTSLVAISISGEEIDFDTASSVSDALNDHPTLEEVCLENCGLDNAVILEKILEGCKGLRHLIFPANNIGSASLATIAVFIGKNYPRTKLIKLESNRISDADVPSLVNSLQKNHALNALDLRKNQFTDDGKQGMTKAVFDTTNVTSLVQSNHTGAFVFAAEDHRSCLDQLEILCMNVSDEFNTKQKIRRKVLFALCRQPEMLFNLLCAYNDFPLGLAPHLLELIQQQYDHRIRIVDSSESETAALSRLFFTLGRWRMPLLFENMHHSSEFASRRNRRRKRKRKNNCIH